MKHSVAHELCLISSEAEFPSNHETHLRLLTLESTA